MARPQKFRHSREALTDPQIAAKLGGFVLDIEALRTTRKQIDDQIAAAFDAVDDAGFEKKYVRKVVSLRAKETDARRDEEEGLEAYEFAIEKGVSLASARSKPVSSQSYAEAKGRQLSGNSGELTDTQEQPAEPATQSEKAASAVISPNEYAGTSSDENPAPHSHPQPAASLGADKAGDVPPPSSPATLSVNQKCQKHKRGEFCGFAYSQASCWRCNQAAAQQSEAA